jgi:hypothetical protein
MVMNPYIAKHIVESHIDDLRRAAAGAPPMRRADEDDALRRPRAKAVPLAVRLSPWRRRAFEQASEQCT